jgi:type IV pilus assembly protein PilB
VLAQLADLLVLLRDLLDPLRRIRAATRSARRTTAAGTFPRLIDLEVNSKIITSAIRVAMAQRLARKLCANCKEEIIPQGEQKKSIDDILTSIQDKSLIPSSYEKIYRAKGCNKCNNTGYSGRIGIYEAILSSKEVEDAVEKNPSEREIWQAAKNQELLTLKQDGVLKVLQGVTSMEELERVIALSD